MTYGADNRLVRYAGRERTYDADGNMVGETTGGLARTWVYDARNRLVRAELGARPQIPGAVRTNTTGLTGGEGFAAGLYARGYTYDGGGRDLLQSITTANPDAFSLPPFAGTPEEAGLLVDYLTTLAPGSPPGMIPERPDRRSGWGR